MKRQTLIFFFLITAILSCKEEKAVLTPKKVKTNKVVLISTNAPERYVHYTKQDSIGKKLKDSTGSYTVATRHGFMYLDYMNVLRRWLPKPNVRDTIEIECYSDYMELSILNFYTSLEDSFLIKNGDTVVFNFKNLIPKGQILNRKVNDIELNYNNYRLNKLFDNKYTSHLMIDESLMFLKGSETFQQKSIEYYNQSKSDYIREVSLLDSLKNLNIISQTNYIYRKDALNMLMEKNKRHKNIKRWLEQSNLSRNKENLEKAISFNLSKTDSLMKYKFFRDYLKNISKYGLELIVENNGNSGRIYLDSRIRFDSIIADNRFNQTARNYLLFGTYRGIAENFKVKDKEKYFKKLQENTTNRELLTYIKERYKLDFKDSDQLILTDTRQDTINYADILKKNKGKWLYIDFWASWCKPCREVMPKSIVLKKELKKENIEFIYLALNDHKENWKKAIQTDGISKNQNYFIENGNTSKIIERLNIKTIPHYLIYNPKGELVNGYAKRPGKGAKEQLKKLLSEK